MYIGTDMCLEELKSLYRENIALTAASKRGRNYYELGEKVLVNFSSYRFILCRCSLLSDDQREFSDYREPLLEAIVKDGGFVLTNKRGGKSLFLVGHVLESGMYGCNDRISIAFNSYVDKGNGGEHSNPHELYIEYVDIIPYEKVSEIYIKKATMPELLISFDSCV